MGNPLGIFSHTRGLFTQQIRQAYKMETGKCKRKGSELNCPSGVQAKRVCKVAESSGSSHIADDDQTIHITPEYALSPKTCSQVTIETSVNTTDEELSPSSTNEVTHAIDKAGTLISDGSKPLPRITLLGELGTINGEVPGLPDFLLLRIFSMLPLRDLVRGAGMVCKHWNELACRPELWRHVKLSGFVLVTDEVLLRLTSYSSNVISVDLTDDRFISTGGLALLAKQCPNIRVIKLVRCFQISSLVSVGEFCHDLEVLHVDCLEFLDDSIQKVASGCPKLREVRLSNCKDITDSSVIALAQSCHSLESLNLDQCSNVTGESMQALAEGCPELQTLSCMSCDLNHAGILHITKLKKLRHLELAQVSAITDAIVMEIVGGCPHIETFNLSLCTNITDKAVHYMALKLKNLKNVYLVSCKLTNQALISLGTLSKHISNIDVSWCDDITDDGVLQLSHLAKSLSSLGLMRCDKVSIPTMDFLVLKYPQVTYSTMWLDCKRLVERARKAGYIEDTGPLVPPNSTAPPHLMLR